MSVIPKIPVRNFERSLSFYQQIGFEIQWIDDADIDRQAELTLEDSQVYLQESQLEVEYSVELMFLVNDVHQFRDSLIGKAKSFSPIEVRDGFYQFSIREENGVQLTFATVKNEVESESTSPCLHSPLGLKMSSDMGLGFSSN